MAHVYSTAPQAVSRYLASRKFPRSRKVQGRLSDNRTTGFRVRKVLGETTVEWVNDAREYKTEVTVKAKLKAMGEVLGERYQVRLQGGKLIVRPGVRMITVLFFEKRVGALGERYIANTREHRYVITKKGQERWELQVFSLGPVHVSGHEDPSPIMVSNGCVHDSRETTRDGAYKAAHEFLKSVS